MSSKQVNLVTLSVQHNVDWSKNDEGNVVLSCERIKNKYLKKLVYPFLKKKTYQVTLDEYGSFVWMKINGKTTVKQIAKDLETQYGDAINPVYDRLGLFLRILANHKYILLFPE